MRELLVNDNAIKIATILSPIMLKGFNLIMRLFKKKENRNLEISIGKINFKIENNYYYDTNK